MPSARPSRRVVGGSAARAQRENVTRRTSARTWVVVTGLLAVASTAASGAPPLRFAYRNENLHLVLVTAEALIGLFAAFLAWERLRRSRRSEDVLLFWALAIMGATNLVFAAIPSVFASDERIFATWASLVGRTLGAVLLAAAVVAPVMPVRLDRRATSRIALVPVGLLCATAIVVYAFRNWLPPAVSPGFAPDAQNVGINATPAVAMITAAGGLCFAIAAAGFARRADRRGDRLLTGLAVACALAAVARVDYLLFPSAFTEWVSIGDALRLAAYVALLIGAVMEVHAYVASAAETAALEERRRIARDLHDRLAQELASIQRNLRWLDEKDRFVQHALVSTGHALAGTRQAIAVLSEGGERPLGEALEDVARRVADREGTRVTLDVSPTARLDAAERAAVGLIASEAITNAARHGRARAVHVELVDQPRLCLRVTDMGRGFDAGAAHDGFGLQAMTERAAAIGARLRVFSRPGEGTLVEVVR